jgi:hypothetical protein
VEGTLALLGIGLHTLQDSIKHSGYNAAQGHIGAHPDPDSACCNLGAAMLSMEVTLNSLRYGRRLVRGRSSPPPPGWKDRILRILTGPAPTVEAAERRWMQFACEQFSEEAPGRTELLERWKAAGGEEVFTRALVKVEETLQ